MKTNAARRMRRPRGFTLMEILLVLAILVILVSLVGVSFVTLRKNAMVDTAKTQINLMESAVKAYQIDVGTFPSTEAGLSALYAPPGDVPATKWRGPYAEGTQLPLDPWNNDYVYKLNGDDQTPPFEITSSGPDGQPDNDDDVRIIR